VEFGNEVLSEHFALAGAVEREGRHSALKQQISKWWTSYFVLSSPPSSNCTGDRAGHVLRGA
jgi:hypothetical protein